MLRERQHVWRRLNLLVDLLGTQLVLLAMILLFKPDLNARATGLLFIITVPVWAFFLYGPSGSYYYRMKSMGRVLKELFLALTKSFLAFTALVYFLNIRVSPLTLTAFFAADAVLLTAIRVALVTSLRMYRARGRSNRNVVIIGTGKKARMAADRICANESWGIHILGFLDFRRRGLWRYRDIPLLGHPDSLPDVIKTNQVDYVIIAVENTELPLTGHAFAVAEEMGASVCLLSDLYYHPISKATPTTFMDFPAVVYSSAPDDRMQLVIKAALDRAGALIGLILSAPIMLAAAAAVRLESRGPVFFRQMRAGKNGKPFTMLKFRTMVPHAEKLKKRLLDKNEMSGPVFKIKNDPRVTKVGVVLRKTSIDELPQLVNVLKGDMSLVGPRPPLFDEVHRYDRWQRRKLAVKPGLTCLWQINGRNKVDFDDWMKLDLEYIDNWSLWLDTKILMKTVPAVIKKNGAS